MIFFWKNKFLLRNYKIFFITNKINSFITKSLSNFCGGHFCNFRAFGSFCMSKNPVFWFTSSKSHLLPLLFNALQQKRTLLNNISKLLFKKCRNTKKKLYIYSFHDWWKKLIKHLTEKKSFRVFGVVPLRPLKHTKTCFLKMFC